MQHDKSDKSPLSDKDSISTESLGPSDVLPDFQDRKRKK